MGALPAGPGLVERLTAALPAMLDDLGAVGGGAHADDEHVLVNEMPRRAALLAALIDDVRGGHA
jgi:glutamate carboxypeptidase